MQAAEEINYLRLLQRTYDGLGTAALLEHDVQQAEQFFIKSLRISQECGQAREMLASLLDIAKVKIARGNLDDALQHLAVVWNHPASDQNSLNHPEILRDEAGKFAGTDRGSIGAISLSNGMGEWSKTKACRYSFTNSEPVK